MNTKKPFTQSQVQSLTLLSLSLQNKRNHNMKLLFETIITQLEMLNDRVQTTLFGGPYSKIFVLIKNKLTPQYFLLYDFRCLISEDPASHFLEYRSFFSPGFPCFKSTSRRLSKNLKCYTNHIVTIFLRSYKFHLTKRLHFHFFLNLQASMIFVFVKVVVRNSPVIVRRGSS